MHTFSPTLWHDNMWLLPLICSTGQVALPSASPVRKTYHMQVPKNPGSKQSSVVEDVFEICNT